ncbi:MAG: 4-(cytidine 5'-diphospho)-2-C-methyl-D-erythritol kinase [Candidatus Zixiibacteriota bacterium]|nr:MAG: 4-(cytidine 5'-diphospho)-2-C-methyl-D-erythritol kinase [candidate division Zixibacteria bacterium]
MEREDEAGLVLQARAKVNMGLRILGQRADGYHEIWSILQEISLADEVRLREAPDFSLSMTCNTPGLPTDERNLCLKAARLLQETTGGRSGTAIELVKRVPVGAGLGGGSADAAAVLLGLNRLWGLDLDRRTLLDLAARLGSDVPFFILGGCCVATGRGEILEPRPAVTTDPMVLVTPSLHVSTAWAYKNIDNYPLTPPPENVIFQRFSKNDLRNPHFRKALNNDFEPLVFSHHPRLQAIKEQLLESGAYYASLSGSGSSLFGVYDSVETARAAVRMIQTGGHTYLLTM